MIVYIAIGKINSKNLRICTCKRIAYLSFLLSSFPLHLLLSHCLYYFLALSLNNCKVTWDWISHQNLFELLPPLFCSWKSFQRIPNFLIISISFRVNTGLVTSTWWQWPVLVIHCRKPSIWWPRPLKRIAIRTTLRPWDFTSMVLSIFFMPLNVRFTLFFFLFRIIFLQISFHFFSLFVELCWWICRWGTRRKSQRFHTSQVPAISGSSREIEGIPEEGTQETG